MQRLTIFKKPQREGGAARSSGWKMAQPKRSVAAIWNVMTAQKKGSSPHGESSLRRIVSVPSIPQIHASPTLHDRHPPLPACGVFVGGKLLICAGGRLFARSLAADSEFPMDGGGRSFGGYFFANGARPMDCGIGHSLSVVLHTSPRADALCEAPAGADDSWKPPTPRGLDDLV